MEDLNSARHGRLVAWYGAAALLAVFIYFYGLGGGHIPKNGDEYPYQHITRMTAASGQWLPLRSEFEGTRNTKPPMLFWQGIVTTDSGRDWSLWNLRWPSVVYTLLTAAMALVLGWRLSGRVERGLIAFVTYLAFFSTYRYGRPFLTDAPSVFWLFLPLFVLLAWPRLRDSRLLVPLVLGAGIGVGLLYRSFALLMPVGLCLSWWALHRRGYRIGSFLARDAGALAVLGVISLAVFSLWFVLDPDPRAIFSEFVVQENAGKFEAAGGYLTNFLWGESSVWRLVIAYPLNAGLLLFPVTALFVTALKRRVELSDGETLLWMWIVTLFVVFCLPSQRDERYVLPGMPALAVLCALHWDRISERAFRASLVLTGVAVLVLAYLALRLETGVPGERLYPIGYWMLVAAAVGIVLTSLVIPRLARPGVDVAVLLALVTFAAFVMPFDLRLGTYGPDVQRAMEGRTLWVPVNFVAREEGHRFLLPGADVRGYPLDPNLTAADLAARYPLFAIRVPMQVETVAGGRIVGQRLDIGTRHTPAQIAEMLRGNVFEHLFVRELIVESSGGHER
jgi:hypothetical protein